MRLLRQLADVALAIWRLPDLRARVAVLENFSETYAGDLDQFEQRLDDTDALAREFNLAGGVDVDIEREAG